MRVQRGDGVGLDRRYDDGAGGREHPVEDPAVPHLLGKQAQRQLGGVRPAHWLTLDQLAVAGHEQQVSLLVQGESPHAAERFAVEIGHADVQLELGETVDDLRRRKRGDRHSRTRMPLAERRREQRYDGLGGRDRANSQHPAETVLQGGEVLAQGVPLGQDSVRPEQDAFALRRQAVVLVAASHDRHVQLVLEFADRGGERGLRDVAGLGGAGEVPLAGQRHQVLQLPHHPRFTVHSEGTLYSVCLDTAAQARESRGLKRLPWH